MVVGPGERFRISLVSPIENNTGFRVWGSKYYPDDVLSEKMAEYFYMKMREVPRIEASRVAGDHPVYWGVAGGAPYDIVVKLCLEEFRYRKKDTLGSKVFWDVSLHLYVYGGANGRLLYDAVLEERDNRTYPLYNDVMETGPVYWDLFEKSPYWPAIRKTLDMAFADVVAGFDGYRVIGQIVAKAERVDGSLSVPKSKQDKLYHVNIGRTDAVREGDLLAVTRASSVRTIAPDTPEMHFPQIVARVRVLFLKDNDAVVEIVKESKDAPIQLGDAVSMPLFGTRDGKRF